MTTTLSAFQQQIIDALHHPDAQLSNHFDSKECPYRPPNGMHSGLLFPNIHNPHHNITVPYRTIAALLRAGMLEESHRIISEIIQGNTTWKSSIIYYRRKENL